MNNQISCKRITDNVTLLLISHSLVLLVSIYVQHIVHISIRSHDLVTLNAAHKTGKSSVIIVSISSKLPQRSIHLNSYHQMFNRLNKITFVPLLDVKSKLVYVVTRGLRCDASIPTHIPPIIHSIA